MKLPNLRLATVESDKITEYLLNDAHPDNGGKALFFVALGFSQERWLTLAIAFLTLARETEVTVTVESSHGIKYIVDGTLGTPSGNKPKVRTVWIVDSGKENPRLVTAYPWGELIMIKEHDRVVLKSDLPDKGLQAGDVASVVHVYDDGEAYEVEFVALDGRTAAVVTVEASQVRPVAPGEIPHARGLVAA